MWRHELIDPDHRHAASGQLAARGAAHRAQTDDDHIGLTNLDMIAVELVGRAIEFYESVVSRSEPTYRLWTSIVAALPRSPKTARALVARLHTDHRSARRVTGDATDAGTGRR
jgi:hypothetical protein